MAAHYTYIAVWIKYLSQTCVEVVSVSSHKHRTDNTSAMRTLKNSWQNLPSNWDCICLVHCKHHAAMLLLKCTFNEVPFNGLEDSNHSLVLFRVELH